MYIIKSNQKLNLYMSYTKADPVLVDKLVVAQDDKPFAIYFDTKDRAELFLEQYFKTGLVKEKNKQYYQIIEVNDSIINFDNMLDVVVHIVDIDNISVSSGSVKIMAAGYYYFKYTNRFTTNNNECYKKFLYSL